MPTTAQLMHERAKAALAAGEFAVAIDALNTALTTLPSDVDCAEERARMVRRLAGVCEAAYQTTRDMVYMQLVVRYLEVYLDFLPPGMPLEREVASSMLRESYRTIHSQGRYELFTATVEKGESYYEAKQYSNALAEWEHALTLLPDAPLFYGLKNQVRAQSARTYMDRYLIDNRMNDLTHAMDHWKTILDTLAHDDHDARKLIELRIEAIADIMASTVSTQLPLHRVDARHFVHGRESVRTEVDVIGAFRYMGREDVAKARWSALTLVGIGYGFACISVYGGGVSLGLLHERQEGLGAMAGAATVMSAAIVLGLGISGLGHKRLSELPNIDQAVSEYNKGLERQRRERTEQKLRGHKNLSLAPMLIPGGAALGVRFSL